MPALLTLSPISAGARRLRLATSLASVLFLLAATASATHNRGMDYWAIQDWKSQPPEASSQVQGWVDWVYRTQGGEYERTGGPPIAAPVPPDFPSDVTDVLIRRRGGSYTTSSGGVTCWTNWAETHVWLRFSDGSEFFWHDDRYDRLCSDWSSEVYHQIIGTGGTWDAVTGAFEGGARSYTRDDFSVQRKASFRASPGATMLMEEDRFPLFQGLPGEPVDVTVGPGGVLDLRNLPNGIGPWFESDQPAVLHCDTILLDPGVQLADLFQPPPIVLPGLIVHEVALLGTRAEHAETSGPGQVQTYAVNLGNVPETAQLSWSDTAGWVTPGMAPLVGDFRPGKIVRMDHDFFLPPAAPIGAVSEVSKQLFWLVAPPVSGHPCRIDRVGVPPAPTVYCTPSFAGSRNGNLQLAEMEVAGHATLTGDDDFVISAHGCPPSKDAFFLYGRAQASVPFHGSTLCVGDVVARSICAPPIAPFPAPFPILLHALSQAEMEQHALLPGTTVYGQFVVRPSDPHSPPIASAAIAFPIGP